MRQLVHIFFLILYSEIKEEDRLNASSLSSPFFSLLSFFIIFFLFRKFGIIRPREGVNETESDLF